MTSIEDMRIFLPCSSLPGSRFFSLDLEEHRLVYTVLRGGTGVKTIDNAGITPWTCAPHVCDVYHGEADEALEILGEVVEESSAGPDWTFSE